MRGEGKTWHGIRWVHLGTDETYLALVEATREPAERWVPYTGKPGLNHLAFEVDDAEALRGPRSPRSALLPKRRHPPEEERCGAASRPGSSPG